MRPAAGPQAMKGVEAWAEAFSAKQVREFIAKGNAEAQARQETPPRSAPPLLRGLSPAPSNFHVPGFTFQICEDTGSPANHRRTRSVCCLARAGSPQHKARARTFTRPLLFLNRGHRTAACFFALLQAAEAVLADSYTALDELD